MSYCPLELATVRSASYCIFILIQQLLAPGHEVYHNTTEPS